jgi:hypothetical protein
MEKRLMEQKKKLEMRRAQSMAREGTGRARREAS